MENARPRTRGLRTMVRFIHVCAHLELAGKSMGKRWVSSAPMVIASGRGSQHGHAVDAFIHRTERLYINYLLLNNREQSCFWSTLDNSKHTTILDFSICWCWGGGDSVFWRILPAYSFITAKGVTHPKDTWIYNKQVKHISKYFKENGSTNLDS